ncbi:unnamed protein product [Acanthoscelides obtectus]|uniref:Lactate/malate dehydrogenase C-terminal domain-containing protein n=1 Tax=Acanthoscelides obtectus TaxID=200917 RepID=A0A9P0Q4K1_ACAOB|nr:unnamed protein product [Acanthoscelides obtectus]CAK1622032.1 hypothetical protein AOBTE_LOCUS1279 [Acanthoscelides obtectus]
MTENAWFVLGRAANVSVHPELKYLSTPVQLGIHGVSKNLGLQELTDYEQCMFDNLVTCLAADITKGEKYIGTHAESSRHAKQQEV